MPAFVTHELLGTQVYQMLPTELRDIIDRYPSAYFWGLQGPDLLFFRDPIHGKSCLPAYGSKMHKDHTTELFAELGQAIGASLNSPGDDSELLFAYAMGFIGHYALDITAHPYIFFLQAEKEAALPQALHKGIHSRLESDIDSLLYQKKSSRPISKYRPSKEMLGTAKTYNPIAALYSRLLWKVYELKVKKSEIVMCFKDAAFMLSVVFDPAGGLVLKSVGIFEKIAGKPNIFSPHIRRNGSDIKEDLLNLNHKNWHNLNIPDLDDCRDFFGLLSQAAIKSKDLIISMQSQMQNLHSESFPPYKMVSFDYGASMTPSLTAAAHKE